MRTWISLFVALLGSTPLARGQDSVMVLPRFEGAFVFDGLPDEPGWATVPPLPVIQYEPFAGAPPTERTEIRFAYDEDYFYASMAAYDRDAPAGIRANTLYRDRLSGDDHFEFLLDTFNDNETALLFNTTPAGNRREAALLNDASGGGIADGGWINVDYNTFWDVKSQITDAGWFTEVRIPFSSLRFQESEDGHVVMGLAVQRKIARRSERLVFPAATPDVDWAFLKPSRAQKILLQGIHPSKPLYLTPYALGGLGRSAHLGEAGTAYRHEDDLQGDLGFDLKYGLTNNLTLDVTVNTDFAQAEADDQQVNLTRFSLFYPEKRSFFQERSGVFAFRTGGESRLFHSRRIGLTETGEPVPILGGARLVGRVGAWDVGVLDVQTAESGPLPSENFGVFRLRRRVFNAYSYAGGIATSRLGLDGTYNLAYGLDGVFRLYGDDYLALQWAHTFDDANLGTEGYDLLDGGRFRFALERRRRRGFGYDTSLLWSGSFYEPGVGFVQRQDFTLVNNTFAYTWMPGEEAGLIWHRLQVAGAVFLRNADGSAESAEVEPSWSFSTTTLASGAVESAWHFEDLLAPFCLSEDTCVPVGHYTFANVGLAYGLPRTNLRQIGGRVELGTFYDGWQASINLTPTWYVSPHLELGGTYRYDHIRFPERDQSFDAHLARLRIGTALNTKLSTNAFLQYNTAAAAFSANLRFRYNFREGNDLWIVYNEGLNTDVDRYLDRPPLPRLDNRTLLIKYTYTFRI